MQSGQYMPAESTDPKAYSLLDAGTDGLIGQDLLKKRRENRMKLFLALLLMYLALGMLVFYFIEGWGPFNATVFCLSILTGIGYGHLIPTSDIGKVATAVYVVMGLVVFATVAGQILDYLMAKEIELMENMIHGSGDEETPEQEKLSYHQKRQQEKKSQFITGLVNASILYMTAVLVIVFIGKEDFIDSIYLASISVMKLDSLCLLDGIKCSAGWHSHGGGRALDTTLAILFYFITCGIIGHFMVSAANYFGLDPEATMTKVKKLDQKRFMKLDKDGDGKVSRSEFLRDRLIAAQICTKEQLEPILKNFDDLDKDGTGYLSTADIEKTKSTPAS